MDFVDVEIFGEIIYRRSVLELSQGVQKRHFDGADGGIRIL
jgi:hypothetical protein